MKPKITPMLKQYLSIKKEYADAILFYRMGDFYEMFFEDAEIASKILEITLTSRNKKDTLPVPMCGFPYRAAKGYIARLIENGHKVAICDQVEDPSIAKGLVKREVVRVITPGMIVEDDFLEEKANNYILCLVNTNDHIGIAYLDISTGLFRLSESMDLQTVIEETHRISPSEILLSDASKSDAILSEVVKTFSETSVSFIDERIFEYRKCRERLIHHFKTFNLEGFGCENLKAGISAAGALLHYVGETQKQTLSHLTALETYSSEQFLMIDDICCKNLELIRNIRTGSRQGTLLHIIDRTITAMGGRLFKTWIRYPLIDIEMIRSRLDAVDEALTDLQTTNDIRECLKSVYDIERIGSKVAMGQSTARDLLALKRSLKMLLPTKESLGHFHSTLYQWKTDIEPLNALADLIHHAIREDAPPAINEGGMIKPGFDKDLDALIEISRNAKGWLAKLQADEKEATGLNSLKVRYNKVFGYYIEIPKTHSESVPHHYVRKQTLVNAERYITEELKTFESKALNAEEKRSSLEYDIFNDIRKQVVANNKYIQEVANYLANVDCLLSMAVTAEQNDYHRPEINTNGRINIEEGRHPVVEKMIEGERFVPNSIIMDNEENQILIITGPNMAGKSTILRQVALTVLMTQMGSFVPANKADIGLTDRIFTRVGALDNLSAGQSTFMVEMQETANILNNTTHQSLVIMDEIGRGTSTFDGLSIAWAVTEYLHDLNDKGVKTLFATHYHKLTDLALKMKRIKNYHIAVKEWNDEIIFLRKLIEGGTSRSYGIQVARLAGIPEHVIGRAKKILFHVENDDDALNGLAIEQVGKDELRKGPVQLSLFKRPESLLFDMLRGMDVSRMTPIDAINCLNELVTKSKEYMD